MFTGILVIVLGQMVLTNLSYPSYPELDFQPETTEVEEHQNTAEEPGASCLEELGETQDTKLLMRLKRRMGLGVTWLD